MILDDGSPGHPGDLDDWDSSDYEIFWSPEDGFDEHEDFDDEEEEYEGDLEQDYFEEVPEHTESHSQKSIEVESSSSWFYDDEGYYAYVLVDGDSRLLNSVIKALKEQGVVCSHVNKSYKPASNGKKYDWYLRVFDSSTKSHPDPSTVRSSLSGLSRFRDYQPRSYQELERIYQDLEIKLAKLQTTLKIRQHELRKKDEKIRDLQYDLRVKSEQHQKRIATYKEKFDVLIVEVEKLRVESNERKSLRTKLKAIEKESRDEEEAFEQLAITNKKELDAKQHEIDDLQNRIATLEYDKSNLIEKMDTLKRGTVNTSGADPEVKPRQTGRENEFKKWCKILLPNLNLLGGSVTVLITEVKNPGGALKILREICWNRKEVKAERVEMTENWFELRYGTGESGNRNGRLYFADRNGKRDVLVSYKNKQKSDIKKLARWERNHSAG